MSRERGAQAGRPAWIAMLVWGLVLAGFLIHFVPGLGLRTWSSVIAGGPSKLFVTIAFALFLLSSATVGALVASRLPGNPIGWLLLGSALAYTLAGIATGFVVPRSGGPAGYLVAADLAAQPLYDAGSVLALMTLLLFPTGSLPSRRWRPVGWLIGAGWLQMPVFVANGDSDQMILPHYSHLLAGLMPQARVKIYPDSAHGFLFQHHAEFTADVGAFLSEAD